MNKYNIQQYIDLFEKWDDPIMIAHAEAELSLIREIEGLNSKTCIDLGAGYGRVIPEIVKITKNIIAIELNPEMFKELNKRVSDNPNTIAIKDDIIQLSKILSGLKDDAVLAPIQLLLQNTLGTIEGDYRDVLKEIKKVMRQYRGEVIVSLYRQQALEDWGIRSYYHGQEMNGEPDLRKCDFEKGLFKSKTGYTSKWWRDEEIENIKRFFGGIILSERIAREYYIIHIAN